MSNTHITINTTDLNNQPIMNIGCLGSVSHGKSTLVKLLTGKSTQQHSKEKVRNITMKVGYANAKIYQDTNNNYVLNETNKLVHHFSFVDCPGHHELIEVMMTGANLMNGGIVVVSGNQSINNQPQLRQHLLTAKLVGISKLIFILNKLDLITKTLALERKYELEEYLKTLNIDNPIIIPMALNLGFNKEYLLDAIMTEFPPKIKKDKSETPIFSISRSFDINRNGINPLKMKGGVVGGSIISGKLNNGDDIMISPGQIKFDKSKGKWLNKPFISKVVTLKSDNENLDNITYGGLTAVGLEIDPFFTQTDRLKGQILHSKNNPIKCLSKITCQIMTLDDYTFKLNQIYYLQIGCSTVQGKILQINKNKVTFNLSKLVPIYKELKVLVSNKINKMIELIGVGEIIESGLNKTS